MVPSVKARPILFSGERVRALLDGRKTNDRRIFKGTTEHSDPYNNEYLERYRGHSGWKNICPYGQPGDLLWVREAWKPRSPGSGRCAPWPVIYRAEYTIDRLARGLGPWKPSIYMFRRDSRLTLKLTDVRVERVQDITWIDANAEGISRGVALDGITPMEAFSHVWNSINGDKSWNENPWVWALTFEVIKQNVDDVIGEMK